GGRAVLAPLCSTRNVAPRMATTARDVRAPKMPAIVPPALRRRGGRTGTYRYGDGGPAGRPGNQPGGLPGGGPATGGPCPGGPEGGRPYGDGPGGPGGGGGGGYCPAIAEKHGAHCRYHVRPCLLLRRSAGYGSGYGRSS